VAEKIPLEPVESSNLAAVGYHAGRKWFDIAFKTGDVWRYQNVPPEVVLAFLAAPSKGTFFNRSLRGQFPRDKMTGSCPACGDHGWIGDDCGGCGRDRYASEW